MKIKCLLKPYSEVTSQHLLEKSENNINPFIIVETEARTKVTTLIEHMGSKLFKEDPAKFTLRVNLSKFTHNRCKEKVTRVQDLLLAEDPVRLEATLAGNKTIKLVVRYDIRERDSEDISGDCLSEDCDENVDVPDDISESELMEMFTEVMSIMLFNKDEQLNKYVGSVSEFDIKAKLPHPSELLVKRRRRKKMNDPSKPKDNEKSEMSQTSQ